MIRERVLILVQGNTAVLAQMDSLEDIASKVCHKLFKLILFTLDSSLALAGAKWETRALN